MDLKELARLGAQARIKELETELAQLRAAFPDQGGSRRRGRPPRVIVGVNVTREQLEAAQKAKGRRSGMSTANRKAQSERMKAYWAARRAGRKK